MAELLRISLLGQVKIERNGAMVTDLASRKAEALLIYLICTRQAQPRSVLADLLWNERPQAQAMGNLRVLLSSLRQQLDTVLTITRQSVAFNQGYPHWVDAFALEAGLDSLTDGENLSSAAVTQAAEALTLYQGPFLHGFYLRDSQQFEAWQVVQQERLHRLVIDGLRTLIRHSLHEHRYPAGIKHARYLLTLEPWREEGHRQLMRLLALDGQREAALAQFETCRRTLVEELRVEPTAETTNLVHAIRSGEYNHHSPQPPDLITPQNPPESVPSITDQPALKLPAQSTPLVGRRASRTAIQGLYRREKARLVTLTGPGGVGKTRLGIQIALDLRPDFAAGVFFVSLTSIQEPDLVISAIAEALAVLQADNRTVLECVQIWLRNQQILLLLDNFEHVIPAASVVSELLTTCPALKMLVTSREKLHLRGEFEYSVPPLATPKLTTTQPAQVLQSFPAIELFRQRGVAANPDFRLDEGNTAEVAELCVRLDGLPLAIELTAAHLKLYSVQTLLRDLFQPDRGSALQLRSNTRDAPARHQSLWHTIAWSYNHLSEDEQALFRHLAVFAGGWTIAAAEAVGGKVSGLDNILELLKSLLDKSLIQRTVSPGGETRFVMLETIREFSLACLRERAEEGPARLVHAKYFLALTDIPLHSLRGPTGDRWLAQLALEHDNLRAAIHWATTNDEVEIALRLAEPLARFWLRRGFYSEGFDRLTVLAKFAETQQPSAAYGVVLTFIGMFSERVSNDREIQRTSFEYAIQVLRASDDYHYLTYPLALLGHVAYEEGNYDEADRLHAESLALAQTIDDQFQIGMLLSHRGRFRALRGMFETGRISSKEGLALLRKIDDKWGLTISLRCMGQVAQLQGKPAEAEVYFKEGLTLSHKLENNRLIGLLKASLATVRLDQEDNQSAEKLLKDAFTILCQAGYKAGYNKYMEEVFDIHARLSLVNHQPEAALRFSGIAAGLRSRFGMVLPPVPAQRQQQILSAARRQLPKHVANAAWAEGEQMAIDEAFTCRLEDTTQELSR